jgi:ABC-type uncharacterized transport system YnjBCD substrate-binding protein
MEAKICPEHMKKITKYPSVNPKIFGGEQPKKFIGINHIEKYSMTLRNRSTDGLWVGN